MHRLILSCLLLSATTIAAELLNNDKLESAYTPEAPACLPSKNKKLPQACEADSRTVTDKAWRDAEQQNISNILNNPYFNNPGTLSSPAEPPTPTGPQLDLQGLQNLIESIPRTCNGAFC